MKKLLLPALLCMTVTLCNAQSSSVYHLETEYTPQNGYRYYFDKLDPQTGSSTRLAQLPVIGFFSGYGFFNCFGHYVFQGIDTTTANGNYINKLYELDTLGNLIRTITMDTASGTWYKACFPSMNSPYYFALRWDINSSQWVLETINAVNGSRTLQTLTALASYSFLSSDAAITRNNIIWMGMDNQSTGGSELLSLDPVSGNISFEDTLAGGYYYDCLNYDCANDTLYGFIAHSDSVSGSELIKVHTTSGTVIHSGRTATGSGFFVAGTHTRLADGSFYVKTSGPTYLLPDFNVSAPTFTMPAAPGSPLPVFCFAAPRESCVYYVACNETSGIEEDAHAGGLNVYPNPVTNGVLNIVQKGNFSYEVMDASGRIVCSGTGNNSASVSVNTLAAGVYVVRVQQKEVTHTKKVIIAE